MGRALTATCIEGSFETAQGGSLHSAGMDIKSVALPLPVPFVIFCRTRLRPRADAFVTGIRYFMIKSWNLDNVIVAQQECLWATQEKNAGLLEDAFANSRHVILLFSANKSMAFQGAVSISSRVPLC